MPHVLSSPAMPTLRSTMREEIAQFLGFSDIFADGVLPWRADDQISETSSYSAPDRFFWLLKGDAWRVARVTGRRVSYSDPLERDTCDSVELCLVRVDGQLRRLDPSPLSPTKPVFDESKRGPGDGLAVRRGEAWSHNSTSLSPSKTWS